MHACSNPLQLFVLIDCSQVCDHRCCAEIKPNHYNTWCRGCWTQSQPCLSTPSSQTSLAGLSTSRAMSFESVRPDRLCKVVISCAQNAAHLSTKVSQSIRY